MYVRLDEEIKSFPFLWWREMKFLFIPTSTTLDSSNNMWIVLCGYIKILSTCKKIKALLKLLKSNVVIPSPHMIFIVSHNFKILHNYKKKIQTMMASGTHELFLLFSFSSLTLAMVMMMMLMMFMWMKAIYKWKKFYMCAFTHYLFMCVQLGAILVYAWRTFLILFSSFAFSLLERTEKRAKR